MAAAATSPCQEAVYRTPPPEVVRMLDAPPPPVTVISPLRDAMLSVESESMPPLSLIARPFHRLAGLRIDSTTGSRRQTSINSRLSLIRFDDPKPLRIELPTGAGFSVPVWSPTGKQFAFLLYNGDESELWIGDALTATARKAPWR